MCWDLWIDYHRRDGEGLTHASVKDVEGGLALSPGMFLVVGNEEADPAVAEVVSIDERGIVLVRVLPGTVEENSARLRLGELSGSFPPGKSQSGFPCHPTGNPLHFRRR